MIFRIYDWNNCFYNMNILNTKFHSHLFYSLLVSYMYIFNSDMPVNSNTHKDEWNAAYRAQFQPIPAYFTYIIVNRVDICINGRKNPHRYGTRIVLRSRCVWAADRIHDMFSIKSLVVCGNISEASLFDIYTGNIVLTIQTIVLVCVLAT